MTTDDKLHPYRAYSWYIIRLQKFHASRTARTQWTCSYCVCECIMWCIYLSDSEVPAHHDSFHHGWLCSPEREGEAYHLSPHFMPYSRQPSAMEQTQDVAIVDTPSIATQETYRGSSRHTFNRHIQKEFQVWYSQKNLTFPLQRFQDKVSWLQS